MISLQLSKLDSILFVKNGSNNSEKFTSSVKIIVLASSRGLDKKNSPATDGTGTREFASYPGHFLGAREQ